MAKIRAYKLAEELGIDRNEIVEKAAAVGVEIAKATSALSEEEVDTLRSKLGGVRAKGAVSEKRVVSEGKTTVIRRRKKAAEPAPEPEPEPEPQPEVVADAEAPEPESTVEEPAAVPEPIAADAEAAPAEPAAEEGPATEEAPAEEQPAAAAEGAPDSAPAPATSEGGSSEPSRVRQPATPPATDPRTQAPADKKGKQRKRVREVVNLQEQEQFARQVTSRGGPRRATVVDPRQMTSPRRKRRDAPAKPQPKAPAAADQSKIVRFEGEISVGELAKQLGLKAAQIQGKLMALGTMVSMNQTVPSDVVETLAADIGFEVQDVGFKEEEFLPGAPAEETASEEGREPRSPIITVMGHVDHGKTSLLDAIRKTQVVDGEAGGITQHIGAYQAKSGDATLTFIDTPGHAAFTAMRARGAQVTDIAVLVVAASEGVMPQTIEAIQHAKAAGCPIVVAINKMDLPGADANMTRQKLMEHELIAEEYGGDTICVEVSAIKGTGLDQLLEMISLQAEVLELKANPSGQAQAVVLEARLDKGRGPVATVLVQDGTLNRGDIVVVGTHMGRVRSLEDHTGKRLKEAGPAVPVQIDGLSGVPEAGAVLSAVESERVAKQIVEHREAQERSGQQAAPRPRLTLEEILAQGDEEEAKELSLVLKTDVHGTSEAVKDSLEKLSTDRVSAKVMSAGVGGITENDVMLARASDAIIVGFNVRPDGAARRAAEDQGVEIRVYQIIYELIDDVKAAMAGLLPPTIKENVLGRAEVRQPFTIPRVGTIAGSFVTEGTMRRGSLVRLIRDGVQVYEGRMGSLRRFKDDVREVQRDFECGIGIENYNDVKPGDVIEAYELEEQPATL